MLRQPCGDRRACPAHPRPLRDGGAGADEHAAHLRRAVPFPRLRGRTEKIRGAHGGADAHQLAGNRHPAPLPVHAAVRQYFGVLCHHGDDQGAAARGAAPGLRPLSRHGEPGSGAGSAVRGGDQLYGAEKGREPVCGLCGEPD